MCSSFAFYIKKEGNIICKSEYQSSRKFYFKSIGDGHYSITAFIKNSSGIREALKPRSIFVFKEVESLSCIDTNDVAVEFWLGKWLYNCFLFSAREREYSGRLFVLLSGAVNRERSQPPVFNRHKWAESEVFPGHAICIADPSVNSDGKIDLGWYVGDERGGVFDDIIKIVNHYQFLLGVEDKDVVFWGSSGGGFAALNLASRKEGSTAVAINAQTNIFKYNIKKSVEKFLSYIDCREKPNCLESSSVFNLFEQNFSSNKIILAQNIFDDHHLSSHFYEFSNYLNRARFKSKVYFMFDERGHVGESIEDAKRIIDMLDL
ncbi:hypothetical protein ACBP93_04470 [Paenalcaligenes hominis]|uniref:hypothetical protein n=1 Tax=Paenalcaligenes hominis TaxID=643674 RepID=UPI003523467D